MEGIGPSTSILSEWRSTTELHAQILANVPCPVDSSAVLRGTTELFAPVKFAPLTTGQALFLISPEI